MNISFTGLRAALDGISCGESLWSLLRKTMVCQIGRMRGNTIPVHENGHQLGV